MGIVNKFQMQNWLISYGYSSYFNVTVTFLAGTVIYTVVCYYIAYRVKKSRDDIPSLVTEVTSRISK